MNDIVTAISNVGFPIVCTLLLGYLFVHYFETTSKVIDSLRTSLDENTRVINTLAVKLDDYNKDKERENGTV